MTIYERLNAQFNKIYFAQRKLKKGNKIKQIFKHRLTAKTSNLIAFIKTFFIFTFYLG